MKNNSENTLFSNIFLSSSVPGTVFYARDLSKGKNIIPALM
jgi:hypothetical protein